MHTICNNYGSDVVSVHLHCITNCKRANYIHIYRRLLQDMAHALHVANEYINDPCECICAVYLRGQLFLLFPPVTTHGRISPPRHEGTKWVDIRGLTHRRCSCRVYIYTYIRLQSSTTHRVYMSPRRTAAQLSCKGNSLQSHRWCNLSDRWWASL